MSQAIKDFKGYAVGGDITISHSPENKNIGKIKTDIFRGFV